MKMIYTLVTFGVTFSKATCAVLYFSSGACPLGSENPKNMTEFFNILRRYKISIAFLQELGLNWYVLSHSQQWLRRVRHHFLDGQF